MRRAKLAAGSIPAGSLPTTTYITPRCFVCDEPIKSQRLSTSLLVGRTQYTHSPLPTKIGGYIGDEFVVVVTPQDALCKHCMALINTMDRLELELRQHRYTLTQHLKIKYKLDGQTAKQSKKIEIIDDDDDIDEPEIIEVSDEEWTPHKKARTETVKQHRCKLCNASYTNLSLFMAHLSRHKQIDKVKATVPLASSVKLSVNNNNDKFVQMKFKCGCCSEYFPTKESLALHMQLHTGPQVKPKVTCILPVSVGNQVGEYNSCQLPKLESTTETSSLFEDIEQLTQHDIPVSEGICLEEQKGRVCLLALLNNGVCSDLSHRAPAEIPQQNISVSCVPKVSDQSEQTFSITVSIPSSINGGQMTEQHISLTSVSDSNVRNMSYPVTVTNTSTVSNSTTSSSVSLKSSSEPCNQSKKPLTGGPKETENFNVCQGTKVQNNFDLPDLLNTSLEDEKLNSLTNQSSVQRNDDNADKCTWPKENSYSTEAAANLPLVPASGESQNLDVPSLLEELLQSNDNRNEEIFGGQVHESCNSNSNEVNISFSQNVNSPSETNTNSDLRNGSDTAGNEKPNSKSVSSSHYKNISDTVKNVAVVNVTSIPMNRDSFDAESDWFYSSSDKEISSVIGSKKINEMEPPVPSSWFHDSDLALTSKKLLNDNCDSSIFPMSSDSCVASQKTSNEVGKSSDMKEVKNTSLPSLV